MTMERNGHLDLSRIAHDLRGPLMPLRTAAWLLRNELGESPQAGELAGIVERQSARLARMMDELSDWGRCMDAPLVLDRRPVDPMLAIDLVIGAIPDCSIEARHLGEGDVPPVQADQHRVAQLLGTLIEHAMHRSGDHPPEIEVSAEDGELMLRVRDHGPTLDEAAREALLCKPQSSPFDEGLGLRLLMARRIAEAHGGSLVARQDAGGGLAMTCRLPLGEA